MTESAAQDALMLFGGLALVGFIAIYGVRWVYLKIKEKL